MDLKPVQARLKAKVRRALAAADLEVHRASRSWRRTLPPILSHYKALGLAPATVIDVGVNKVADIDEARDYFGHEAEKRIEAIAKRGYTLVGDVHPAEADRVAGKRTPVPGGVGLLTVAMLMKNTLQAAQRRRGL